jgi:predicted transcriptional regulator
VVRRGLTQAAAGKLLGISQPNVSALLNGRLD